MSMPFDLASGIFLIFFWIDITSSSLYHGAFLDKAFWPAMILVTLSFILVSITSIMLFVGFLTFGNTLFTALTQYLNAIGFIVAIIYFIAAHRVHKYTRNKKDPIIVQAFFRMMVKIILSGVILIFVFGITIGFIYNPGNTSGYIFLKFAYDWLCTIRSFLMIDLFGSPPREKSKTTSNNSSTGDSHSEKHSHVDKNSQLSSTAA